MENTKFKRVNHVPWQAMEDRALLLQPEVQMGHEIHGVGTWIWENLGEEKSFDEIIEGLTEEFEVDRERAVTETRDFLQELRNYGLIRNV